MEKSRMSTGARTRVPPPVRTLSQKLAPTRSRTLHRVLGGARMTRVQSYCRHCVPPGRMQRTYDYNLKIRLLRLVIPCQRVRCDSCGHEAWALSFGWTDLRNGEVPPGVLVLFCIIALIIAVYIAR